MQSAKFPKFREKVAQGQINLLTDTIKIAIIDINAWTLLAISGATNAGPIVITTGSAHGLVTGDEVFIWGVAGNTAANGYWKVTVLTTTTFSLDGSTGNGAYSAGMDFVIKLNSFEFLGDIDAGARVALSGALTGKAITRGYFTSATPLWSLPNGNTVELVVWFKDTGNVATSPLCAVGAIISVTPIDPDGSANLVMNVSNFHFRV